MHEDYHQLLVAFGQAFNQHDEKALVGMMTEDAIFYTVAGNEVYGNKIVGTEAIQKAFVSVWEAMPDAYWEAGGVFVNGNSGVADWVFSGTNQHNGTKIHAQGCDIFTFKNGKISVKNAFRKQVS